MAANLYSALSRRKTVTPTSLEETKLARVLSTMDLTFMGIGATLGVGIYVLAGQVAKETAGPAVIISFLIAAIASAFAGFCYAEFGARVPKAGSAYVYTYFTVGEFLAFIIGWNLILEYVIGAASVTKGLSTYIDSLAGNSISNAFISAMPMDVEFLGKYPDFFAFAIVMVFSVCLAFGMQESSIANNLCTGVNIAVVIFVVIAGAINAKVENWSIAASDIPDKYKDGAGEGGFAPFGIAGIIKGAATCFYGFIGFDCVATTGEEAKTPQKSIPLAIVFSLAVIFAAYFSVSTVLTLMWPYFMQDVNAPLTYVFDQIDWDAAKWVVSIGAIFGLLPSLLGSLYPLPRIIYAMSIDGLLFEPLGRVHPRFKSPVIATLLSGFLTGIMALLFELSQLVDMLSIGTLLAYTIVAACVLMLRYRKSDEDDDEKLLEDAGILRQSFNLTKLTSPSQFSSSLVTWLVALYCLFSLGAMAIVAFMSKELDDKSWWAILLLTVLLAVAATVMVMVGFQPKSKKKLSFMVPFVPVVPALSILVNLYLMLMLDVWTWIRFAVWIVIGILIYFLYGIRHSNERFQAKSSETRSPETSCEDLS